MDRNRRSRPDRGLNWRSGSSISSGSTARIGDRRGGNTHHTSTASGSSGNLKENNSNLNNSSSSGFSAFKNIPQAAIPTGPRRSLLSMENRRPIPLNNPTPRTPQSKAAGPPQRTSILQNSQLPPTNFAANMMKVMSTSSSTTIKVTDNDKNNDYGNDNKSIDKESNDIVSSISTVSTPSKDGHLSTNSGGGGNKKQSSNLNPESPSFEIGSTTLQLPPAPSTVTTSSSMLSPFPLDSSLANLNLNGEDNSTTPENTEPATPETSFADDSNILIASPLPGISTETRKVYIYTIIGDVTGSRGKTETKITESECYASICVDPMTVEESELWNYLSTVMHDDEMWMEKNWPCILCARRGIKCSTNANPYLELGDPIVVVYQLPVCTSVHCLKHAPQLYLNLLELMKGQPPYLIDYRCLACGKDTGQRECRYRLCGKCSRVCHSTVWPEYNNERAEERRRAAEAQNENARASGDGATTTTTTATTTTTTTSAGGTSHGTGGASGGGGGGTTNGTGRHRRRGGRSSRRR